MKYNGKITQFINHRNNIKHKRLVYVGEESIQSSQWKCDSITSTMKGVYKSGKMKKKNKLLIVYLI